MLIVLGTEWWRRCALGEGGNVRMRGEGRCLEVYRGSKSSEAGVQMLVIIVKASLGYAEAVVTVDSKMCGFWRSGFLTRGARRRRNDRLEVMLSLE
jgi:hypothetical protein